MCAERKLSTPPYWYPKTALDCFLLLSSGGQPLPLPPHLPPECDQGLEAVLMTIMSVYAVQEGTTTNRLVSFPL